MTSIDPQLIADNLAVLRQGRALLDALDATAYSQNAPAISLAGVGPHLRHVLDFYARFLTAIEGAAGDPDALPEVDYDERERDPRVETDRDHAAALLESTEARMGGIARLTTADAPMRIKSDGSNWIPTTVGRELQALVSHTVHHYALIAVAVRCHGGDPGVEFGVAPSTLRHWREQAATDACAR